MEARGLSSQGWAGLPSLHLKLQFIKELIFKVLGFRIGTPGEATGRGESSMGTEFAPTVSGRISSGGLRDLRAEMGCQETGNPGQRERGCLYRQGFSGFLTFVGKAAHDPHMNNCNVLFQNPLSDRVNKRF